MLELLRGTPSGLIVVSSAHQARELADRGYGSRIITSNEIRRGGLQGHAPRLLIDNAEFWLHEMFGRHEVAALSFTGEGEILRRPATTEGTNDE